MLKKWWYRPWTLVIFATKPTIFSWLSFECSKSLKVHGLLLRRPSIFSYFMLKLWCHWMGRENIDTGNQWGFYPQKSRGFPIDFPKSNDGVKSQALPPGARDPGREIHQGSMPMEYVPSMTLQLWDGARWRSEDRNGTIHGLFSLCQWKKGCVTGCVLWSGATDLHLCWIMTWIHRNACHLRGF